MSLVFGKCEEMLWRFLMPPLDRPNQGAQHSARGEPEPGGDWIQSDSKLVAGCC